MVAKDKEMDAKKKKGVPKEDTKKVEEDNAKTDGVIKRQRHENCVTIKPKKKANPDEPKKGMMTAFSFYYYCFQLTSKEKNELVCFSGALLFQSSSNREQCSAAIRSYT